MKKQTAVEWLVEQIMSEVDKYNDDCTEVVGVEYWNAFRSCTDLSEYVDKAKQMEQLEKLKHQLFIGKVSDEIGFNKTVELLKEVNQAFNT